MRERARKGWRLEGGGATHIMTAAAPRNAPEKSVQSARIRLKSQPSLDGGLVSEGSAPKFAGKGRYKSTSRRITSPHIRREARRCGADREPQESDSDPAEVPRHNRDQGSAPMGAESSLDILNPSR